MQRKHIFIIKPNKRSIKIEKIIVDIMKGYNYVIRYTAYAGHAIEIAKEYRDESHRIYAVGGDGMVHEVVQGIVGSNNELVVVPNGTGNDFVRTISNTKDARKIITASLKKDASKMDLIKMNDIYCVNVMCCALDSVIGNNVHNYKATKYIPTSLQYTKVMLRKLKDYQLSHIKMYENDELIFDDQIIVGAFCNAKYFGGGFEIGKKSLINDGKMDVALVKAINKKEIPYYLSLLIRGKLDKCKEYHSYKLNQCDIEVVQDINIDGEKYPGGNYHIEVIPSILNIVVFK